MEFSRFDIGMYMVHARDANNKRMKLIRERYEMEWFLGKKIYNKSLLVPFEGFLQASFSRCHNNNLAMTSLTFL